MQKEMISREAHLLSAEILKKFQLPLKPVA